MLKYTYPIPISGSVFRGLLLRADTGSSRTNANRARLHQLGRGVTAEQCGDPLMAGATPFGTRPPTPFYRKFGRLVLSCIAADFCKQNLINTHCSPAFNIYSNFQDRQDLHTCAPPRSKLLQKFTWFCKTSVYKLRYRIINN